MTPGELASSSGWRKQSEKRVALEDKAEEAGPGARHCLLIVYPDTLASSSFTSSTSSRLIVYPDTLASSSSSTSSVP
jgi:hypothetical protein